MYMNQRSLAYSEHASDAAARLKANQILVGRESLGVVDSLLHPAAVLIRQILTRSGRLHHGLILIDDEENILQALQGGVEIHSIYYSGDEKLSNELLPKLPRAVQVYGVAKRTCKKLFDNDKISRVFALAYTPAFLTVGRLADVSGDIVALEDLTISGNIGAIIRTAVAFGAGGIVLLNAEPVDLYDRRIIRASRGHIFSLPVIAMTTEEFIRFCKQNGLPILVMEARAGDLVGKVTSMTQRFAIVFGSEKDGCSLPILNAAAYQVQIPTSSSVESLNVSTAAGIMLYNRLWFNQPGRTE